VTVLQRIRKRAKVWKQGRSLDTDLIQETPPRAFSISRHKHLKEIFVRVRAALKRRFVIESGAATMLHHHPAVNVIRKERSHIWFCGSSADTECARCNRPNFRRPGHTNRLWQSWSRCGGNCCIQGAGI